MAKSDPKKENDPFTSYIAAQEKNLCNVDYLISRGSIKYFKKYQVEEFIHQLSKYSNSDKRRLIILNFVQGIDFYCDEYVRNGKHLTLKQRAQRRKYYSLLIRDTKMILARLERIASNKDIVGYPTTIEELAFMEDRFDENCNWKVIPFMNETVKSDALKVIPNLKELISSLEIANSTLNPSISRGREKADTVGLVKIIAMFYKRYIGTPTIYHNGGFVKAVELTLEYLGLPHEYPTRSIKQVISSLKAVHNQQTRKIIISPSGRVYTGYAEKIDLRQLSNKK